MKGANIASFTGKITLGVHGPSPCRRREAIERDLLLAHEAGLQRVARPQLDHGRHPGCGRGLNRGGGEKLLRFDLLDVGTLLQLTTAHAERVDVQDHYVLRRCRDRLIENPSQKVGPIAEAEIVYDETHVIEMARVRLPSAQAWTCYERTGVRWLSAVALPRARLPA